MTNDDSPLPPPTPPPGVDARDRSIDRSTRATATASIVAMSRIGATSSSASPRRVASTRKARMMRARAAASTSSTTRGAPKTSFVLRNCGDRSMGHLDAPVRAPGDLFIDDVKSVIGRSRSEAVNLPIEVPTVSGAHAMIDVVDGKVMVTDLTSTNGTFIDGEELLPGVPTRLLVGGEVIFGDEFLARFELVQVGEGN